MTTELDFNKQLLPTNNTLIDTRNLDKGGIYRLVEIEDVDYNKIDEHTAIIIKGISVYGEMSTKGYGLVFGKTYSPPLAKGSVLNAIQKLPPLWWSGLASRELLLQSAESQNKLYEFKCNKSDVDIPNKIPNDIGPRRVVGWRSEIIEPKTRIIESSDGPQPCWKNNIQGTPLNFIEIEIRWSGLSPLLSVSCIVLGGEGEVHDELLGIVCKHNRWWLSESRYAVIMHALSVFDCTGGYNTITVHLSELPPSAKQLYFVVNGDFRKTDYMTCILSSRESIQSSVIKQQYAAVLQDVPKCSARGVIVSKLQRTTSRWNYSIVEEMSCDAQLPDALLPLIYSNMLQRPSTRKSTITEKVKGISVEKMTEVLQSDIAPSVCKLFNKYDTDRSGTLSVSEFILLLEDLHWDSGTNPPPTEVLKRMVDSLLRSADLQTTRLSLQQFAEVLKKSSIHDTIIQKVKLRKANKNQLPDNLIP